MYCELEVNDDALPLVGQGDHTGSCRKQTSSGEFDGPANLVVPKLGHETPTIQSASGALVGHVGSVPHPDENGNPECPRNLPRMSSVWLGLLTAQPSPDRTRRISECHHPVNSSR